MPEGLDHIAPALRNHARPIGELLLDPNNARAHDERNLEAIKASLARFGQQKPVIVNAANIVVAGNGTVLAARSLGWANIAAVTTNLETVDQRAYAIADNRTAELAAWSGTVLSAEMESLKAANFDVSMLNFSAQELADLIGGATVTGGGGLTDPDALPDSGPAPASRRGDVWLCGQHRILCGDSTHLDEIAALMAGEKAAWMWTDPPYGVDYVDKQASAMTIENDGAEGLPALLRDAFAVADQVLDDGSPFYIACPPGPNAVIFGQAVINATWRFHQILIWVKNSMVLGHSDYHYQHEPVLYGWKGTNRRWFGDRTQVTVFNVDRPARSDDHPTSKPVALIVAMLKNSCAPNSLGYEPFAGSFSTLIAAHQLGLRLCSVELNPVYVDVGLDRFLAFTGVMPTLASTGQPWQEIKETRRVESGGGQGQAV